jgi:hypothetical protein
MVAHVGVSGNGAHGPKRGHISTRHPKHDGAPHGEHAMTEGQPDEGGDHTQHQSGQEQAKPIGGGADRGMAVRAGPETLEGKSDGWRPHAPELGPTHPMQDFVHHEAGDNTREENGRGEHVR